MPFVLIKATNLYGLEPRSKYIDPSKVSWYGESHVAEIRVLVVDGHELFTNLSLEALNAALNPPARYALADGSVGTERQMLADNSSNSKIES